MLATRSCVKPKPREQTHPMTSFCPVILTPAGVQRECCSTGRNSSWKCYAHNEKGIWAWITAMKKYKYGHSSIYLSSQNSAAGHGNSALGLKTNFPELTDLNRAPAAFLYLGYE